MIRMKNRELYLKIIKLHNKGVSFRAIRKHLKCDYNLVKYAIKNQETILKTIETERKQELKQLDLKKKTIERKKEREKEKQESERLLQEYKRERISDYINKVGLLAKELQLKLDYSESESVDYADFLLRIPSKAYNTLSTEVKEILIKHDNLAIETKLRNNATREYKCCFINYKWYLYMLNFDLFVKWDKIEVSENNKLKDNANAIISCWFFNAKHYSYTIGTSKRDFLIALKYCISEGLLLNPSKKDILNFIEVNNKKIQDISLKLETLTTKLILRNLLRENAFFLKELNKF